MYSKLSILIPITFLACLLLVGCVEEQEIEPIDWSTQIDTSGIGDYEFIETDFESDYIEDTIIREPYRIAPIEDPCPPCPDTVYLPPKPTKWDTTIAHWKKEPVYQMPPGRWVTIDELRREEYPWPDSVFILSGKGE